MQIDGSYRQEVGGYAYPGSMYPIYRNWLTIRGAMSSPLTIALTCTYDTLANTGTVNATVTNTTTGAISGTIQFAVIENAIPYSWGPNLTTVEHVCRDMLPDGNGEAVTIPASSNIVRSRNFTIDAAWNEKNVNIIVFVQSSAREVYQAAQIGICPTAINMEYAGQTFTETSGNGNRVAQPGEGIRAYLKGKNRGAANYTGTASISTSDPYITITGSTPQTINISPGDMDTVLVTNFNISASCPVPRMVNFLLNFNGAADTNTVRFIVTNTPGFSDNIESGQGQWTHSGLNDNWHITTYRSHSATHSWYCGVESNHLYTANNDASLITPYFVVTPDSALKYWYYDTLELDYDYVYTEIDNNCGWWQVLRTYNAGHLSFTQDIVPVSEFSGQTVRVRFHFFSDGSVQAEGFYVDDVSVPVVLIGVDENKAATANESFSVWPRVFTSCLNIQWRASDRISKLGIYDATGRLVKSFNHLTDQPYNQVVWSGTDDLGNQVPAGTYFVRMETQDSKQVEKVMFLK